MEEERIKAIEQTIDILITEVERLGTVQKLILDYHKSHKDYTDACEKTHDMLFFKINNLKKPFTKRNYSTYKNE